MSIYDYSVSKPSGEEVSLGDYKGKVMLIVNTATGCGFTPQYKDIEELYEKYRTRQITATALAKELNISRSLLYKWFREEE